MVRFRAVLAMIRKWKFDPLNFSLNHVTYKNLKQKLLRLIDKIERL